ncbi:MAG: Cell cycle serine/threonine-protein kinase cdc5/MSD2, partial [Watsoniomyces obsoletus]
MGVVADTLEHGCLKSKPEWLLNADPRGDKVRPGYGITHSQICRAAGVGRGVDGRPRPGVGAKSSISTLVEIEAENRQGYAPTVPLPEGILYSAFTEAHAEWALRQKYPIQPAKPRSRKPVIGQAERDGDDAVLANIPTTSPPPIPHATRNVPSFAAQQRRQALPSRPAPRQVAAKDLESLKEIEEPTSTPATIEGLLKARPMRAASVRVTRSASAQSTAGAVSVKTLPKSTTLPTLAESKEIRGRAKTFQVHGETVPESSSQLPRPKILTSENATTRPRSALSTESTNSESRALRPTTGNDRRVPTVTESGDMPMNAKEKIDPLSDPNNPFIRQKPRIISASELSSNAATSLANTTNLE